ncbi:MAG: PAS domain S-box protein, partial [Deltaproteobacteria bacterium]|nr:PAS domain S-box protein [Deltaproteobacteria bacterium]
MSDKSLRTLIVDDSEDDVLLIIRELKKGGYNPVYERVETAAKMKKALLENQWDIILCDYRLPKFNAPSAIALLKETNLNLPVIIISGKIGEETAVECMRLGAKDYILKDNLIRLCPAIARELEEAKVRQREKKAEEALRESERKYQLLFDNSIDAIAVFGGKPPKFLFVNPAFLRLFGYTLEEILAFSPDDIFLTIYPDDRKMVKKHLRDRFRQEDNYNRYEFRVVTKDGQVRWVEISATLFSKNGQFLSQAICRDITER